MTSFILDELWQFFFSVISPFHLSGQICGYRVVHIVFVPVMAVTNQYNLCKMTATYSLMVLEAKNSKSASVAQN